MRPRTITVDISRGGAWALRDYRRQSGLAGYITDTLRVMAEVEAMGYEMGDVFCPNGLHFSRRQDGRYDIHIQQEDTDGS